MTDDLLTVRRLHKAKLILLDPDHPGFTRLVDELDSWIDIEADMAALPDWGTRRRPTRLITGPLP